MTIDDAMVEVGAMAIATSTGYSVDDWCSISGNEKLRYQIFARAVLEAALLKVVAGEVKRLSVGQNDKWPEAVSDGLVSACQGCGEVPNFDYHITDDKWRELVPGIERLGVICLPCLDRISAAKGIDFADALEDVQFTGTGQTIIMRPTRIVDYAIRSSQEGESK